jgi:LemA protein
MNFRKYLPWIIIIVVLLFFYSSCKTGYNNLVSSREQVTQAWANVETQYQRRADLVPNLVSTVKGAADFEKSTLEAVMQARANATSIHLNADELTPENIQKFQQAQNQLSGALGRLLAVAENYPQLRAVTNFQDLQAQLEGTENRISEARRQFNQAGLNYNTMRQSFPTNIMANLFGFKEKAYFQSEAGAEKAPQVKF